ncbi:MAG: hypothetical protein JXA28_02610, partial [Bacteroidetes bacterium]|nr:hypothetical protein [Bacteroidota bacterium]
MDRQRDRLLTLSVEERVDPPVAERVAPPDLMRVRVPESSVPDRSMEPVLPREEEDMDRVVDCGVADEEEGEVLLDRVGLDEGVEKRIVLGISVVGVTAVERDRDVVVGVPVVGVTAVERDRDVVVGVPVVGVTAVERERDVV